MRGHVKRTTCDCGRYEVRYLKTAASPTRQLTFEDGEHGGVGDRSPVHGSHHGGLQRMVPPATERRTRGRPGVSTPNPVTGVITGDVGEVSPSGRAIKVLTSREVYTTTVTNSLASSLDHPYVLNLPSADQTIGSFLFFTIHLVALIA
jgi:hypothetical protein